MNFKIGVVIFDVKKREFYCKRDIKFLNNNSGQ